ncbi:MAG TPA: DUF190 domain-containing protein [Ktedonobacteraceae bacterium]|nr:DUF190 domain-containing protein [Ktedonobacteraceae bacterium]
MSLLRQGKAWALTMYLGESDQWQGQPAYVAIIHFLRSHGCAGATAMRAVAGYGAGAVIHEQRGLRWSSDASIVVQVIDQPRRLERLLPHLQEILNGGMITIQDVDVLKYTHARRHGLPANVPVSQIMEQQIMTTLPETPVAGILELLLAAPFRLLPVVDQQRHLLGIISTGDLIAAGALPVRRSVIRTALALDPQTAESVAAPLAQVQQSALTARTIMNRQVRTIHPELEVREAARIMLEAGLRRLPVVDAQQVLVGMLTRSDLLQLVVSSPLMSQEAASQTQPLPASSVASPPFAQQQPIAHYVDPDVTTVTEETPLEEVIEALLQTPLKRVLVVDQDRHVKGIISDVDVLARVQMEIRPGLLSLLTAWTKSKPLSSVRGLLAKGRAHSAADVMNRSVITIVDSLPVQDAVAQLLASKRKFLPVVDEQGRLSGTVGRSQLLRLLVEAGGGGSDE